MIVQLLPERKDLAGVEDLESAYLQPSDRHLRVNFISSLDGAIEFDGRSGPLGGPADRSVFMAMRAVADVIVVGAGTARTENYGPVRLGSDAVERRLRRGQRALPPLAVVTARGSLDPGDRMFESGGHVIVFTTGAVAASRADLAEVAEVVGCGDARVDLAGVLKELEARGMGRVLCEGGPELMRSLLMSRLVDELCLTVAPVLAGPQRTHLTGEAPLERPELLELSGLIEGDGMLMTRYRVGRGG